MTRKCFVPHCRSGYTSQMKHNREQGVPNPPMFTTPLNPEEFEVWSRKIPRQDRNLAPQDAVCGLHFKEDDIDFFTYIGERRKNPILKPGAIPTVFPNCPKYLTRPSKARRPPKKRKCAVPPKKRGCAVPLKRRKSVPGFSNIGSKAVENEVQKVISPTIADLFVAIQSTMMSNEEFTDYTYCLWKNNCIIIQKWDSNFSALNKLVIMEDFKFNAYVKESLVVIDQASCSSPADVLQVLLIIKDVPICNADLKRCRGYLLPNQEICSTCQQYLCRD